MIPLPTVQASFRVHHRLEIVCSDLILSAKSVLMKLHDKMDKEGYEEIHVHQENEVYQLYMRCCSYIDPLLCTVYYYT